MKVTQEKIAQDLGLHPATVSKILNRKSDDYTSVETKQKVFDLALKLGYDFQHLKSVQTRKNTRKPVDLPVQVIIVMVGNMNKDTAIDEVVWDRGQARVCDISQSGALLADLQLSKNTLPLQPFRLKLTSKQGGLTGIEIPCQVVRLETDDQIKVGLKFDEVSTETRNRLAEFCSN